MAVLHGDVTRYIDSDGGFCDKRDWLERLIVIACHFEGKEYADDGCLHF